MAWVHDIKGEYPFFLASGFLSLNAHCSHASEPVLLINNALTKNGFCLPYRKGRAETLGTQRAGLS
jgi:hypothetical protein